MANIIPTESYSCLNARNTALISLTHLQSDENFVEHRTSVSWQRGRSDWQVIIVG